MVTPTTPAKSSADTNQYLRRRRSLPPRCCRGSRGSLPWSSSKIFFLNLSSASSSSAARLFFFAFATGESIVSVAYSGMAKSENGRGGGGGGGRGGGTPPLSLLYSSSYSSSYRSYSWSLRRLCCCSCCEMMEPIVSGSRDLSVSPPSSETAKSTGWPIMVAIVLILAFSPRALRSSFLISLVPT